MSNTFYLYLVVIVFSINFLVYLHYPYKVLIIFFIINAFVNNIAGLNLQTTQYQLYVLYYNNSINIVLLILWFFFLQKRYCQPLVRYFVGFCFVLFLYPTQLLVEMQQTNLDLLNGIMLIHPLILFWFYSFTLFYVTRCLYTNFLSFFIEFFLINVNIFYLQLSFLFYFIAIFLGAWWAEQELLWGGWWSWDFIELLSLSVIFLLIALAHQQRFNIRILYFLLIYATFLMVVIRFNLINSIHNFILLDFQNQYVYYCVCIFFSLTYTHYKYAQHQIIYTYFLKYLFTLIQVLSLLFIFLIKVQYFSYIYIFKVSLAYVYILFVVLRYNYLNLLSYNMQFIIIFVISLSFYEIIVIIFFFQFFCFFKNYFPYYNKVGVSIFYIHIVFFYFIIVLTYQNFTTDFLQNYKNLNILFKSVEDRTYELSHIHIINSSWSYIFVYKDIFFKQSIELRYNALIDKVLFYIDSLYLEWTLCNAIHYNVGIFMYLFFIKFLLSFFFKRRFVVVI